MSPNDMIWKIFHLCVHGKCQTPCLLLMIDGEVGHSSVTTVAVSGWAFKNRQSCLQFTCVSVNLGLAYSNEQPQISQPILAEGLLCSMEDRCICRACQTGHERLIMLDTSVLWKLAVVENEIEQCNIKFTLWCAAHRTAQ